MANQERPQRSPDVELCPTCSGSGRKTWYEWCPECKGTGDVSHGKAARLRAALRRKTKR